MRSNHHVTEKLTFFVLTLAAATCGAAPFEKAGPNLVTGGDFEGSALTQHWKWTNNGGGFSVKSAPGRNGRAAALLSTTTKKRGKFFTRSVTVPAGAHVRVSLWAKAKGHVGGTWVNFEGPAGAKSLKFDIAGGTYDWTEYVHRMTIPMKKFSEGQAVRMAIWFYVYGKGTLLLDDVECRVIQPDAAAESAWARSRAQQIGRETAAWKRFKPQAPRTRAALDRLDALVRECSRAVSGSKQWGVLVAGPTRRVLRDRPYRGVFTREVRIDAARHEFEGAQLLLFAHEKDLNDVSVSVSDLTGPGTISAANIQILPVGYVASTRTSPWYEGPATKHWADPLLPNRSFTVKQGTVQPVYLRVYVPKGAKAGRYRGEIEIRTASGAAKVPIRLRVHDVILPDRLHFKTMCVNGKKSKPYLDLSLEQRIAIGNVATGMSWTRPKLPAKGDSFDFSGVEKKLRYCLDRGMNSFIMASTPKNGKWGFPKSYSPAWKANMSKVIREYGRWLKQKGWLDMAYFNNIDEPGRRRWDLCRDMYRMAKAANPDVKVFHCVNMLGALDALKGFADVWDVYVQHADQQQAAARQAEGCEIWWAICIWPREHPNLYVHYPLMDARIVGWSAFKYGVDGFEYWHLTSWAKKAPKNGSWARCADGVLTTAWQYTNSRAPGEGYLCYPGDGGKPINSLRLEALRDGFEDHELLWQLRQKLPALSGSAEAEARKLLDGGDGLVINMFLYSTDSSRLLATRKRVFKLLDTKP